MVALLHDPPGLRGLTEALVAAGPELRVRLVAEGAVIHLFDGSGRLVAAVQAAQRLAAAAEADRILGAEIPDDLPAQPWWVEARALDSGPTGTDTVAVVRRFADSLVGRYGGLVVEPEQRMALTDDFLTGSSEHPAVAALTNTAVVVVEDRPVVPLSTWLLDAVSEYGRAGRFLQLVTPPSARITPALLTLLAMPQTRWVVATDDGRYHDGFLGLPLTWHERHAFVVDEDTLHERGPRPRTAADQPDSPGCHLLVDLKVVHPADAGLVLGTSAELLAERLSGAPPALFGPGEPVSLVWDTAVLTGLCRSRIPAPSWLVFTGLPEAVRPDGVRPFSGTLRVKRVAEGVEESVSLTVVHPPGEQPDLSVLPSLVREFAARDVLVSMTVRRMSGRPDPTYGPWWPAPPAPLGLALGTEGVSALGRERALAAPVRGVPLGPPMTPSVWYRIGDGTGPDAWDRFQNLMQYLHPESRADRTTAPV